MDIVLRKVDVTINGKQILQDITGHARKGQLLTIMGPSGAGKTTLLNVLANRCNYTSGEIKINGTMMQNKKLNISYVPQKDVYFANLKLKETLMYIAMLILPDEMLHKTKEARVDEIITLMQLNHCVDTVMGDEITAGYGLSGGERKRASIASKLLSTPKLLLLDEPTTGLDSTTAFNIVKLLKSIIADGGITIVQTIHQPASRIFQLLSGDLLLLTGHGQVVYSGETSQVTTYFSQLNLHCPIHFNPADFLLDIISKNSDKHQLVIDSAKRHFQAKHDEEKVTAPEHVNDVDGVQICEKHRAYALKHSSNIVNNTNPADVVLQVRINEQLCTCSNDAIKANAIFNKESQDMSTKLRHRWATGYKTQLFVLTKRSLKQSAPRMINFIHITLLVALAFVMCLSWFQMPFTESNLRGVRGVVHYVATQSAMVTNQFGVEAFHRHRAINNAERQVPMYRTSTFLISTLVSEGIVDCSLHILLYTIVYWTIGLGAGLWLFLASLGIFLLGVAVGHAIGVLSGALIQEREVAGTVALVYMVFNFGATDVLITNWPHYMNWIKYTAFMRYVTEAILKLEFSYGNLVLCGAGNETRFTECAHVQANISQPHNVYVPSSALLGHFNYTTSVWADILILLAMLNILWLAMYVALRFVNKPIKIN